MKKQEFKKIALGTTGIILALAFLALIPPLHNSKAATHAILTQFSPDGLYTVPPNVGSGLTNPSSPLLPFQSAWMQALAQSGLVTNGLNSGLGSGAGAGLGAGGYGYGAPMFGSGFGGATPYGGYGMGGLGATPYGGPGGATPYGGVGAMPYGGYGSGGLGGGYFSQPIYMQPYTNTNGFSCTAPVTTVQNY